MLSPDDRNRYARQLNLPNWGEKEQLSLKNASVLIVGAGALGCPVISYLAAAGVGRLGIVDDDLVELSNLHRQILYGESHIGMPKVHVAKKAIEDRNPNCSVQVFQKRINSENAFEISESYDIIIDGTDNFPTRYLINDLCVLTGKVNVHGSIQQFSGQVAVFNGEIGDERGPNYRDLYPLPPNPNEVVSCEEGGVIGVLPGIIGNMMALECIKVITGIGDALIGKFIQYDALSQQMTLLTYGKNPENPLTGETPSQKGLIDYLEFCRVHEKFKSISWTEAELHIGQGNFVLLDVREKEEFRIDGLDEAINVPLSELELGRFDQLVGKNVLVYCQAGNRSKAACNLLKGQGIHAMNIEGGILAHTKKEEANAE